MPIRFLHEINFFSKLSLIIPPFLSARIPQLHYLEIKRGVKMQHNENLTVTDFINSGNAFFIQGQFKHAIIQYTNAIIQTPIGSNSNLVYLYNNLASAYFYTQDYNKAITYFTKAIILDPNDASLRINRSNAHTANSQSDKAQIDIYDAMYLMQIKLKNLQTSLHLKNDANQPSVMTNSIFNNQSRIDSPANDDNKKYNSEYRP